MSAFHPKLPWQPSDPLLPLGRKAAPFRRFQQAGPENP